MSRSETLSSRQVAILRVIRDWLLTRPRSCFAESLLTCRLEQEPGSVLGAVVGVHDRSGEAAAGADRRRRRVGARPGPA